MDIEILDVRYLNGVENHYIYIENYEGVNLELLCLEYCVSLNKFANLFIFNNKEGFKIHLAYPNQSNEEIIQLAESMICTYFYNQEDIGFESFPLKNDLRYKEYLKRSL